MCAWREGVHVVSEAAPRVVIYPHFLSEEEASHVLRLAQRDEPPPFVEEELRRARSEEGPGGRIYSVSLPTDDPIVQSIEERCAAATGVAAHPLEAPLGIRCTLESSATAYADGAVTGLHVDTNQNGTYRCATVLIYLEDLRDLGGETRFPVVHAPEESALRRAATAAASTGATLLHTDPAVERPPLRTRKIVIAAAEAGAGLCLAPRRGMACVFWTFDQHGLDPASWHTGTRVAPGATKWLCQKFKELPAEFRDATFGPPRLPAELAPPPPAAGAGTDAN
jgi:hypothetical protein